MSSVRVFSVCASLRSSTSWSGTPLPMCLIVWFRKNRPRPRGRVPSKRWSCPGERPGHLDRGVLVDHEQGVQAGLLLRCEEGSTSEQGVAGL